MQKTEIAYVDALHRNNEAVISQIYANYLPRVSAFIRQNGGSEEDAQDIFQEALITIYRKSKAADFELKSKFYTFLYGICRNLWGNQLQKKSRSELRIIDNYEYEHLPETEIDFGALEERQLFWEAFEKLGEDCQKLLRLFFAKTKMEKITEQLALSSVGYAKKKKFKCKEKLVLAVKADQRYAELKMP